MIRLAALLVVAALAHAAGGRPPWHAPANPMALTRQAHLTPETHEFVFLHIHSHLDVFVDGRKVLVPAGIGIDTHAHAVKRFRAPDGSIGYGGISPPCAKPCISPLHTHFDDGVLHTEAKRNQFNRLGQFFTEWKVRLDRKCVGGFCKPAKKIAVYVNGRRSGGDPRSIQLKDRREIAIVIGKPPGHIPSAFP
jgi:hypothetical protein